MSLTGMPSRLISRSDGRPPALWPSSRTIPARRAVRRANGAARPGTRSVKMRRSHSWFRHLQRPRQALMTAFLERIDPRAFASKCCGAIRTVRRIPDRRLAADCTPRPSKSARLVRRSRRSSQPRVTMQSMFSSPLGAAYRRNAPARQRVIRSAVPTSLAPRV